MDAVLSRLNGIDATHQVVSNLSDVRVTVHSETVSTQSVRRALEARAVGYLSRYCFSEELMQAIHDVVSEGTYLSSAASKVVVQHYLCRHGDLADSEEPLTPRQHQIAQRIAEGASIKSIARVLGLSPNTADWQTVQVMKKLRIENTAGLVRYAFSEGLTSNALWLADVGRLGARAACRIAACDAVTEHTIAADEKGWGIYMATMKPPGSTREADVLKVPPEAARAMP